MEATLKAWKTSRKLCLDVLNGYSLDQLNLTPPKFSNNIIWNIGHIVAAQQSIVYRGANLTMNIPDDFFEKYKPGTRPGEPVSQNEVDQIKSLLTSMIEKTEEDLNSGKFVSFNERTTITGFHLASLQDALVFNNYHEGLHLGYMKSIARFV